MRSRDGHRRQNTPYGAYLAEKAVKLQGPLGGPSPSPAQSGLSPRESGTDHLMEEVVARTNMLAALKRVEKNAGAPGVDRITVAQLRDQCRTEWPRIREELLAGTYRPKPVRRVEIPKSSGMAKV